MTLSPPTSRAMTAADAKLSVAHRVIAEFRRIDPTMPSQEIAVFLAVCEASNERAGGILQADLEKRLEMTQAAVSRNVRNLGDQQYALNGVLRDGRGLVSVRPDPLNRKRNIVGLAEK